MMLKYATTEQAKAASGLRMIVVGGVPSPWSEAAKGLLHIKNISWMPVYLDQQDRAQAVWAQSDSAPVVFWEDENPVSDAAQIVSLVQRIAPDADLVPEAAGSEIMEFINLLAAPGGLGWHRRLQQIHAGLEGRDGGFHPKIAAYLGAKYGYDSEAGALAEGRANAILKHVSAELETGGDFLFCNRLTAADIYCSAFMALFSPLPDVLCAMRPSTRVVFAHVSDETRAVLSSGLLAHRDRMYQDWLATPLSL